jgi:hypothetical protein
VALAGVAVATLLGPASAGAAPADELRVSGVPSTLGRNQVLPVNVSGVVPRNFLFGNGRVSVVVVARDRVTRSDSGCTNDDPSRILIAKTIATESFSITKRVRVRSDLDFTDRPSIPFRICAMLFANALRTNQSDTDASIFVPKAKLFRVTEHHADLPHRVTGRVATADGTGVGGATIRASGGGGGAAITGPNGRYDLFLGRGTARLTPSAQGATFAPGSRTVRVPSSRAQDFVATVPAG